MRARAKVGFAGAVTMYAGEVREIGEGAALDDLLAAGYVEAVEEQPTDKAETRPKGKLKKNETE